MKKGILFCLLGIQFFCIATLQVPCPINVTVYNNCNDQKNSAQPNSNMTMPTMAYLNGLLGASTQSFYSAKNSLYDYFIRHWQMGILIGVSTIYVSLVLFVQYANKY